MTRASEATHTSLYDIDVTTLDGQSIRMDRFADRVLLIVNVASRCGFTPQYEGLEALHRKFTDRGFLVLGFPCNQFGAQEPGTSAEIQQFCSGQYHVTFPLFQKIDVNGENAHPLFEFLKSRQRGFLGVRAIRWNFTKFLVDRHGEVVERFGSATKPSAIEPRVNALLG
jgi:glutathione peroxidase